MYPTTMGFPTKNDRFGMFWGYHHLRNHPYRELEDEGLIQKEFGQLLLPQKNPESFCFCLQFLYVFALGGRQQPW